MEAESRPRSSSTVFWLLVFGVAVWRVAVRWRLRWLVAFRCLAFAVSLLAVAGGCWLLAVGGLAVWPVGCWLLAVGGWLFGGWLVGGCGWPVAGLRFGGCGLLLAVWRLAVDCWLLAVGGWRVAVGGWRLAVGGVGCWRVAVGGECVSGGRLGSGTDKIKSNWQVWGVCRSIGNPTTVRRLSLGFSEPKACRSAPWSVVGFGSG